VRLEDFSVLLALELVEKLRTQHNVEILLKKNFFEPLSSPGSGIYNVS
jgi:hypothetical protein